MNLDKISIGSPFFFHLFQCGSMGNDLIYCNSCCEAYHPCCLNENERPRLHPPPESWLCPKCNVCKICGQLTHGNGSSTISTNHDHNGSGQMISCSDCQRNFHLKCLKRFKDDQWFELNQYLNSTTISVIAQSRLSYSFSVNQHWSCPSCLKCDCGQEIQSNERNLISLGKTFLSQQALMCGDCLNNFKFLRLHKNDQIDRCHLCDKYLEQILIKSQNHILLQCTKCQHRFHPRCDGFLNEDSLLLSQMNKQPSMVVCSKCDIDQKNQIQKDLLDSKLRTMRMIQTNLISILKRIFNDENSWQKLHSSLIHLEQLHESRQRSFNLHAFLNDVLILVRTSFSSNELHRWQAVIDGCILRQCPWFKSSSFLSNSSTSIVRPSAPLPSLEHDYASQMQSKPNESHRKKHQFALLSDSLLDFLDEHKFVPHYSFENIYETDQRKCQLCETFSDHPSLNVGRLIPIGLSQWVHVGCILPAYAKNLDQPPYILRNIRETVARCQTKYVCALCSKLGASVHCHENECYQRFHCQCIQKYYSNVDPQVQQNLRITNGFLPNLTTYCLRHNGLRASNKAHRDSADVNQDEQSKESKFTEFIWRESFFLFKRRFSIRWSSNPKIQNGSSFVDCLWRFIKCFFGFFYQHNSFMYRIASN